MLLLTIEPVMSEGKRVSHIPRYILLRRRASFNGLFEGRGMPLLWHGVRGWSIRMSGIERFRKGNRIL